ncbi:MAG: Sec-dependent nitrous-oxide reductase [Acidimicrobiales bacterium]|nr:Sec-dependent nitrous-oxide reductase [Acidimicrobiales bacterium]
MKFLAVLAAVVLFGLVAVSCNDDDDGGGGATGAAADIAEERGLSDADVAAALKTYVPSGQIDEYITFASGGQSGQVHVIGVPSMRLLRTIAVFTPEPWQGYGYGAMETEATLDGGNGEAINGQEPIDLNWADTHHPALSETEGDYDGQFLFINDKANSRLAVIDLRDFATKQLVRNPVAVVDHGGTFVTPNTDWIIEGGQYGTPPQGEFASLDQYKDEYQGLVTFWKFDRAAGRIDEASSFAMQLPPYWQDLCDSGKLVSEGWVFCNSINTELSTGMTHSGEQFEAGTAANETDYLHAINLNKAAEIAAGGGTEQVNGFNVIPLQTSIDEGLLYFVPEPKSPHGSDVTPDGKYVVVSGKLDTHANVYSTEKLIAAVEAGTSDTDEFGVPVLKMEDVLEAQVELGLGPLHTQFDNQGYAYTSLFLDSAVARWSLGGDSTPEGQEPWQLVTTTPVQYNIGHLVAAEGDTVEPDGRYLIAMNKWAIDRFFPTGPLLPQNFQLVDISQGGETMPVLYDSPIGVGEPHYAQMIKADKLQPWLVYPVGTDPGLMAGWDQDPAAAISPNAVLTEQEAGVTRDGKDVTINMTVVRSHYTPDLVEVKQGDHVIWHLTNIETTQDATHGFTIPGYDINVSLEAGKTVTVEFDATQAGVFSFYCTEFCSALHLEMMGYFTVEP